MSKVYIFIDNGSTGTIGVYGEGVREFFLTPAKECQDYTKSKKTICRVDYQAMYDFIHDAKEKYPDLLVVMERPMTNSKFNVNAQFSGMRAFEATLIAVEQNNVPHMVVDSKQWQKKMLPDGLKSSAEQKKASMQRGIELFPEFEELITKHKDADGILGAYCFFRERY